MQFCNNFWQNKKVLITGGLGFIGSNLAIKCVELGADVTVYDCLDPKSGGNMVNIENHRDRIKILVNDIRNFEGLSSAIIDKELVYNCAAYTSHPNSMKDPINDIEVNCKGVINLLESGRRFNPKAKIIQIGTSTQTGRMVYEPMNELHPEFPVDIYSANKTASEKYFLIYGQAYKMKISIIRIANTYGPRSNISTPDFGFMNYFIGLALKNKEIPVFGEGQQKRNINFVDDIVNALILAGQSKKSEGEVLFAAAEKQYTVMETASAISSIIGGQIKKIPWPKDREAIEIGDAVISNQKINNLLGWTSTVGIEDGLRKTKDYFMPRLEKYLT